MSGTNAAIYDATGTVNLFSVGNAAITSTATKKYAASSIYFDGGSFLMPYPHNNKAYAFRTNDFTVEAWVNRDNYANSYQAIVNIISDKATTGNPIGYGWNLTLSTSFRPQALVYTNNSATGTTIVGASALVPNQWYHLAMVRNGLSFSLYVDGVMVANTTLSAGFDINPNPATLLNIGTYGNGAWGNYFKGYIEDLRITYGVAQYTENFTPPTGPL